MPDWKTHLKVGLVFEIITLIIISGVLLYIKKIPTVTELFYIIPILVVSPLIPDIDHPTSKITDVLLLCGLVGLWIAYFFMQNLSMFFMVFITAVFIISRFIPHRGFTHSIWFIMIYSIGVGLLTTSPSIGIVGLVGAASHIHIDK